MWESVLGGEDMLKKKEKDLKYKFVILSQNREKIMHMILLVIFMLKYIDRQIFCNVFKHIHTFKKMTIEKIISEKQANV